MKRRSSALLSGRHGLCLLDYNLEARTGLDLLREVSTPEAVARRSSCSPATPTGKWMSRRWRPGRPITWSRGSSAVQHLERAIRYAIGFAVERHQTLEALRRSEERYALAVRGANDGLWDWDLTTDRIYYAPRWKSMLGYEDAQIGDSILEWFNRVNPLDVDRVKAEVSDHLAGKTSPPRDRAPHAPRGRDLPLGPHARPGRARRPGEGRPDGRFAVRHHPEKGRPSTACSTTRSTTP